MPNWKIHPARLFLLVSMIVLMLLIVVLPGVDLPYAAFHRGTAPALLHAQATSAPLAITVATALPLQSLTEAFYLFFPQQDFASCFSPNFRPIFLRSIRC